MKTVKEVAKLTGVSIRTLQYYHEVGVFMPTEITDAGYRLYDDDALKTLQQILFFKELDFQLKEIKEIMENPKYNKLEAFKKQKELIKAKRDRLDGLLCLLEKLENGETCMSFKEFDMSEYIDALEQFKNENIDDVIKNWGSIGAFEDFIEKIKDKESEVAKMAIRQYGSVEKYTEAMKDNLAHFSERMEAMDKIKEKSESIVERNKILLEQLFSDLTEDVSSNRVQDIVHELVQTSEETNAEVGMDMGDNFWDMVVEGYLSNEKLIEYYDKIYGSGASQFTGRAYQYYFNQLKG